MGGDRIKLNLINLLHLHSTRTQGLEKIRQLLDFLVSTLHRVVLSVSPRTPRGFPGPYGEQH